MDPIATAATLQKNHHTVRNQKRDAYQKIGIQGRKREPQHMNLATQACLDAKVIYFHRPIRLPSTAHPDIEAVDEQLLDFADAFGQGEVYSQIIDRVPALEPYDFEGAMDSLQLASPSALILFAAGVRAQ